MKTRRPGIWVIGLLFLACFLGTKSCSQGKHTRDLPNILWIVSEDNSAYFTGCYGNPFATTPNIDRLAGEGFLYTHAYCPNAVCAPSRNTLLTGVYSSSNGNENMRSTYALSEIVRTYPEYLREAGYYCTNNSKTDYNTNSVNPDSIWDESSRTAHYKNRPEGKPFFAVFNSAISHESCLFNEIIPDNRLRHDPSKVTLPPYHPDTPEMRHDWAQYYDRIEDMDSWVGELLQELEESGLAENTIVFYYGDNGGVLPRSKRFVYETGTQIPLVIRIPEKFRKLYPAAGPGEKVDRMVNFVDFVPTLLSIAGIPVPEYLQGDAYLGKQKKKDPQYTFMTRQRMDERYDNVRAVRDKQYRYIRNYMPFRITMQHVNYLFNAMGAQSWEEAFRTGRTNKVQSRFFREKPVEELYDTENDPWEVHNLATDPEYADILERMRGALDNWRSETRDVGVIPETEYESMAGDMPLYDYVRSENCPFEKLIKASDLSVLGGPDDMDVYRAYLQDESSAVRYWGVTGLLVLKDAARPAIPDLEQATNDSSGAVATLAAEALYRLGDKETALRTYIRLLDQDTLNEYNRTFVLNSIDAINESSPEIKAAVQEIMDEGSSGYDTRIAGYLLEKWNKI